MPVFEQWIILNEKIVAERLRFVQIEDELLQIIKEVDEARETDAIDEGEYRQKGNFFRNMIIALVKARCGLELRDRKIQGRTDVHDVDLSALGVTDGHEIAIVAGEVKMLGSPAHVRGGREYDERTISIDIDKRLKEVKYTPIDLKRRYNPEVKEGWSKWIRQTSPKFFSAWLMRLATKDKLERIIRKLEGLAEYNNAVGAALYQQDRSEYEWVKFESEKVLTVDGLVDIICGGD